MPAELRRFLLVYSSQTGQAKAIAEEVAEKAPDHGFQADVHCISETEKRFWLEREKIAVIITSTTGDGEPPDNAHKFWRRLKKRTLERTHLSHLRFSLLGLGDSNYSNFCNFAKNINRRLEELEAVPFCKSAFADDAVGLELVVEPWIEGLFPALRKELYADPDADTPPVDVCVTNGDHSDVIIPLANSANSANMSTYTTDVIPTSGEVSDISENKAVNGKPSVGVSVLTKLAMDSTRDLLNNVNPSPDKDPLDTNGRLSDFVSNAEVSKKDGDAQGKAPREHKRTSDSANKGDVSTANQSAGTSGVVPATQDLDGALCAEESLTQSIAPLSESALTLPVLPAKYLKIAYNPEGTLEVSLPEIQNGCLFPSAKSEVVLATIVKVEQLTRDDALKKSLKIALNLEDCSWDWRPGDSFGLLCPNPEDEVDALLQRLGAIPEIPYTLEVMPGTKKRAPAIPPHVPPTGTLWNLLTHCLDIRAPPKKALLRSLVEYTTLPNEVRRLQELCSKQGAESYSRLIREPSVCLLDLLTAFPSCTPPVERLIEHLQRLQPRPYSAASSPVVNDRQVDIVFNVVDIPAGGGRCRRRSGVCTGHLDKVTAGMQIKPVQDLTQQLQSLTLKQLPQVPVYLRSNQHFRPPPTLLPPIIMIGPGTGVAPFVGFLQEREKAMSDAKGEDIGESWLFFGCRHKDRDYIFRDDLEHYEQQGVLSRLVVSFSRDNDNGEGLRYVQDMVRHHAEKVLNLIMDLEAMVYVCGDARGMARGVNETFSELLQTRRGYSEKDAAAYLMQMRLAHRYKEDVWT